MQNRKTVKQDLLSKKREINEVDFTTTQVSYQILNEFRINYFCVFSQL